MTRRTEYYQQLDAVGKTGNWEAWLAFFFAGVEQTSNQAIETARRILNLFEADRAKFNKLGRKAGNASRVFEQFTRRPLAPHNSALI